MIRSWMIAVLENCAQHQQFTLSAVHFLSLFFQVAGLAWFSLWSALSMRLTFMLQR